MKNAKAPQNTHNRCCATCGVRINTQIVRQCTKCIHTRKGL